MPTTFILIQPLLFPSPSQKNLIIDPLKIVSVKGIIRICMRWKQQKYVMILKNKGTQYVA